MAHVLTHTRAHRAHSFNLVSLAAAAVAVWRQRRALASLDAAARRDLGLTDGEIHIEASRPLWDVPQNWRF
jgi:uncharacterized protein YjiS (DUF1127 family)